MPEQKTKTKKDFLVSPGRQGQAFSEALRGINGELCRALKSRKDKYYVDKNDARYAFRKYKGRCAYCSLTLQVHPRQRNSVHLELKVPVRAGGEAEKGNLIPVCKSCKEDSISYSEKPLARVEGYNTIPDLIVRIVEAVREDQREKLQVLSAELNLALSELVFNMKHSFIPNKKRLVPIVEGDNTLADIVIKAAEGKNADVFVDLEGLQNVEETIKATKTYRVIREF